MNGLDNFAQKIEFCRTLLAGLILLITTISIFLMRALSSFGYSGTICLPREDHVLGMKS